LLCKCLVCQQTNGENQRTRPSLFVELDDCQLMVDLSPDFRQQLLRKNSQVIANTVLFTHAHHDHIGGLGDYADLCFWQQIVATLISPSDVIETIRTRYPYLAKRPSLIFQAKSTLSIGRWIIAFHRVNHGANGHSYGLHFQTEGFRWAYIPDAINLSLEEWQPFEQLDLLILGTSYWDEEAPLNKRSVYSVKEALEASDIIRPKQLIFTHLSHDIDITEKSSLLPPHVRFAYDGLKLKLT
jgi:phosphoribosyl 1,2-cyclic phosphate phosphodiesterase